MALKLPVGGGGDFKIAPAGTHIAICNLVADMGLQPGSAVYPTPKRRLYLRFEIPQERISYELNGVKHEGPLTIGQQFTASMNKKATLRLALEGWRGRSFTDDEAADFDISKVLGQPCTLIVSHNRSGDRTYANISSIGPIPRGMPKPTAENPLLYYGDDDPADFDKLPNWLQEKIKAQLKAPAPEPAESHATDAPFDDDIPF